MIMLQAVSFVYEKASWCTTALSKEESICKELRKPYGHCIPDTALLDSAPSG